MLTVYNLAELHGDQIVIDGNIYKAIKGKHCIWVPDIEAKIVWTHHGKIEAYKDWEKGRNAHKIMDGTFNDKVRGFNMNSLYSIINEYLIMSSLSKRRMTPPTNGFLYIRNFVSNYPYGREHCDSIGKYGYFIRNANDLPHGKFDLENFKSDFYVLLDSEPSSGAIGDLGKESNTVNGYLIDIRRTIWDMISMKLSPRDVSYYARSLAAKESKEDLEKDIFNLTQFPHKMRKKNYQSYLFGGGYNDGSRDTLYRMDFMGVPSNLKDMTVLDLGCNLGAFCFEAYKRGARKITGLDYEIDYIKMARRLSNYNGVPINFLNKDLTKINDIADHINGYYKKPVSIVFALSLYKHIKGDLWKVLSSFDWVTCYLEGNNAPEGLDAESSKEIMAGIESMGVHSQYLGQTNDRSPRCVWILHKK